MSYKKMLHHLNDKLVTIAQAEIGVCEEAGNNQGKRIKLYQQATWLLPDSWPWCAAFMAWVLQRWLIDGEVRKILGLATAEDVEKWRCRDATAFGWVKWAKQKQIYTTDEKELAKKGDFVVFDFSHIGIVVQDQQSNFDAIQCIEGNTNVRGERDSKSGDGVWMKTRKINLVYAYIRILK